MSIIARLRVNKCIWSLRIYVAQQPLLYLCHSTIPQYVPASLCRWPWVGVVTVRLTRSMYRVRGTVYGVPDTRHHRYLYLSVSSVRSYTYLPGTVFYERAVNEMMSVFMPDYWARLFDVRSRFRFTFYYHRCSCAYSRPTLVLVLAYATTTMNDNTSTHHTSHTKHDLYSNLVREINVVTLFCPFRLLVIPPHFLDTFFSRQPTLLACSLV